MLQALRSRHDEEQLVAEIEGTLVVPESHAMLCFHPCDMPPVPLAPAAFQWFGFAPRDPHAMVSTLRVEIEPVSPGVKWWAVVSAADNATNVVTLHELR